MGRTDPGQGEWGELRYKTTQNKGEQDSCGYTVAVERKNVALRPRPSVI